MRDPDDIPGADGPPPGVRVNVGIASLLPQFIATLARMSAVLAVLVCLVATQGFVWLKMQARATEHAQTWIDQETQRDPGHLSRDAARDELAKRILREFPLSDDERRFIAGSGWTPGLSNVVWPIVLLAMMALRMKLRKTTLRAAARAHLIAAAIGAVLGSIGAIATFGPLLR